MPCTACGSSSQSNKNFTLIKPKTNTNTNTNKKIVYLTPQQIAIINARRRSSRRTLVFT